MQTHPKAVEAILEGGLWHAVWHPFLTGRRARWQVIDAAGKLVSTPFVDAHSHMDSTLSYGRPRVNASGTLLEGIALWGGLKPVQTRGEIVTRALDYCRQAIGKGILAIRSHVDVTDPDFKTIEALRLRPARLSVISNGKVVAQTRPSETKLRVGL